MITTEIKPPGDLLEVIAIALKQDMKDYRVKKRNRYYTELRAIGAMLLKAHFPNISNAEIGAMFDQDHSSVNWNVILASRLLETEQQPFLSKYVTSKNAVEKWIRE